MTTDSIRRGKAYIRLPVGKCNLIIDPADVSPIGVSTLSNILERERELLDNSDSYPLRFPDLEQGLIVTFSKTVIMSRVQEYSNNLFEHISPRNRNSMEIQIKEPKPLPIDNGKYNISDCCEEEMPFLEYSNTEAEEEQE